MEINNRTGKPKLEYPEDGGLSERDMFYDEVLALLGPASWCAAIITPTAIDGIGERIENDCHNLLEAIELPHKRLAWLVPYSDVKSVLPGLFGALKPDLILIAFDFKPDVTAIETALKANDAFPASKLLFFQDSELYEVAGPNKSCLS